MADTIFNLLNRVWWRWTPGSHDGFSMTYHWFNLLEGTVWLVVAGFIARRAIRFSRHWMEWLYASSFALFGISDWVEAWQQSTVLILAKALILLWIVLLRQRSMCVWYPGSRVY
ncbi:MAG: hypothetical protein KDA91_03485 [Planctomycetaceae bacterium]|nr:hypothetical protein [Planctomycetaceae bacterium]